MHVAVRWTLLTLAAVLTMALQVATVRAGEGVTAAWSPVDAAKYLDGRADFWQKWSGSARGQGTACISCHTTLPYALARPALAGRLGETAPGTREKALIAGLKQRVANWDKIVGDTAKVKDPFVPFYGGARKPSALGTEAVLNALVLVNHDVRWSKGVLSETTKTALGHLWQQQKDNGGWIWLDFGLNPWEGDAAFHGASLAAFAVGMAGKPYYEAAEVQPKVAALQKYLTKQFPNQRLHHRMVSVWASSKLPGIVSADDKKKVTQELLAIQETDGGWSLPKFGKKAMAKGQWGAHGGSVKEMLSDGYATGLAVLTLKSAGVPANDAAMKKALAWLARTQRQGTWPARYINRERDPESNVGMFMRDAGVGFAILALTE